MADNTLDELSILMVVPSQVQGRILRRAIDGHGVVNIRSCHNLAQALTVMTELKPDLVISSMYFEDGDGVELVTTMRSDAELEHILFMLVSSEERFDVLDPIRQAGVIAVLPKPFDSADVCEALDRTIVYLAEDAEAQQHVALEKMRTLVVDDSRLARRHLIKVLLKLGLEAENIEQSEDGQQAIDVLAQQSFDLVLTDYNMPVLDGEGLLVHIRQQEALQGLPVIMITSEKSHAKLDSIQAHGVTALLDKPFDPPHLRQLLQTCA